MSRQIFDKQLINNDFVTQFNSNITDSLKLNFFQKSSFNQQSAINQQIFSRFSESFDKNTDQRPHNQISINDIFHFEQNEICFPQQENKYYLPSFSRGKSTLCSQIKIKTIQQRLFSSLQEMKQRKTKNYVLKNQDNLVDFYNIDGFSNCLMNQIEQDLISIQINPQRSSNLKSQISNAFKNKTQTKNVTKNLGKLLFHYIWKNRQLLKKKLNLTIQVWNQFLVHIKNWKKENNITRQYLISKWSGREIQSKIFRMISNQFFRKNCLPAIFKSRIQLKKVHYQRISKFREAIVDKSALEQLS